MNYVLPQEAKTQKLNSLPDDLRKIADELIANKFGIREEVEEFEAPQPFRQEYGDGRYGAATQSSLYGRPTPGNGIEMVFDPTRLHGRIARKRIRYPSSECIIEEGIRALDMEDLPRTDRQLFMGRNFFRELMRGAYAASHFSYTTRGDGSMGQIFGCRVFRMAEDNACYLQVEF